MNNKKVVKVSLTYKNTSAPMVSAFTGWIIACLTGNAAFPEPPIALAPPTKPDPTAPVDMTTRKASLDAAISAAEGGGTVQTAAKNAALQFVVDGLDALAFYVQTTARYDLPTFISSGFQAASTNRGQSQLDAPSVSGIDNDISTQLDVHLSPIANAVGYEVQTSTGTNAWQTAKFSTQARTVTLTGLTTGSVVQVRARALGGSTGKSDWSAPSSSVVD